MKRFHYVTTCCAAVAVLCTAAVLADELMDESYWTDFEPASGYEPGQLAPDPAWPYTGNQPYPGQDTPLWEEKWLPGYNHVAVDVTTAQAHSGSQSIEFTGIPGGGTDVISNAQHIGMLNGEAGSPLVWQERFSVYVPSTLEDPRALRVEPFNNWPDQGYTYQLALYTMGTDFWRPELNNGGGNFNDLRDELGKPEGFETDTWWTVSIIADGATRTITAVSISDDFGNDFSASGLSEPFGLGNADRPERVNYYGADGVFLDDVSVIPEPGALALLLLGGVVLLRRR
ncbi:MAG: PEP-CTERM sorting domain-containing protein [Phycisphaerae bacterium]